MQLVFMVHVTSLTVLLTNRALMSNAEFCLMYNWLAVRFQRNKYFLAYQTPPPSKKPPVTLVRHAFWSIHVKDDTTFHNKL